MVDYSMVVLLVVRELTVAITEGCLGILWNFMRKINGDRFSTRQKWNSIERCLHHGENCSKLRLSKKCKNIFVI